ncbi:hypothetical protein [Secundilactobacillus yichangensis]|uniref:hypothetical protein n=1 Tax=Secundilactobacillus yichangensis TaxID=2799580 RepID=UPI0019432E16|nr:hypothetical protein [Secundilactobacillus yichangensis]
MTITFNQVGKAEVKVEKDAKAYGTLKFDAGQHAWIFWPVAGGVKVTFSDDLKKAEQMITDENSVYGDEDDEDFYQYDD